MSAQVFKRRFGFTLIELLVVITIIGILSVAFIPQLTGSQARARDARRIADLQQIATALEFYANDNSGQYPHPASGTGPYRVCVGHQDDPAGLGTYMSKVLTDPKTNNNWNRAPMSRCDAGDAQTGSTAGALSSDGGYDLIVFEGSNYKSYMLIAEMENTNATGENYYRSGLTGMSPNLNVNDDYGDFLADPETLADACSTVPDECQADGLIYIIGN